MKNEEKVSVEFISPEEEKKESALIRLYDRQLIESLMHWGKILQAWGNAPIVCLSRVDDSLLNESILDEYIRHSVTPSV